MGMHEMWFRLSMIGLCWRVTLRVASRHSTLTRCTHLAVDAWAAVLVSCKQKIMQLLAGLNGFHMPLEHMFAIWMLMCSNLELVFGVKHLPNYLFVSSSRPVAQNKSTGGSSSTCSRSCLLSCRVVWRTLSNAYQWYAYHHQATSQCCTPQKPAGLDIRRLTETRF